MKASGIILLFQSLAKTLRKTTKGCIHYTSPRGKSLHQFNFLHGDQTLLSQRNKFPMEKVVILGVEGGITTTKK